RNVAVPAPIGRHAGGVNELPFAVAVAAPGGEEGAARVELQDAAVDRISCPDVPALVGRHAEGGDVPAELSVARPLTPPGGEEGAARVELLDAGFVELHDVDVPDP